MKNPAIKTIKNGAYERGRLRMKQYVFLYSTNEKSWEERIAANGMTEAIIKASKIKEKIKSESCSLVGVQFKGVVYPNFV